MGIKLTVRFRPTSSHLRLPLQITAFGIFLVRFEQLLLGRKQTAPFMSLNGALPPICRLARIRGGQYRQIFSRGGPMSQSASEDIA
jgi:hypothetical protein